MEKAMVKLHNRAVSLYSQGNFPLASKLFQKATSLRQRLQEENVVESRCCIGQTQPATSFPETTGNFNQTMGLDEGVNSLDDTEPLQEEDSPQELAAILLFNAGQAKRRMDDFDGAMRCYEQAALHQRSNSPSHRIAVALYHNLGQLAYRSGDLDQAISYYSGAF